MGAERKISTMFSVVVKHSGFTFHNKILNLCNYSAYKRKPVQTMAYKKVDQLFDYFLVLDFEATCQEGQRIKPQEIIEFPVLKVHGKSFETEAVFHQYVGPEVHTELTPFCTELTGIVQDMVDNQPNIRDTLQSLDKWMYEQGLKEEEAKITFVTCGDWDLKTMLPGQAEHFNLKYPNYLKRWINIKKPYAKTMGNYPKGLDSMLTGLGMKFEGRPHSGIDDCRNIARVLKGLAERGCLFQMTGSLI